MKPAAILAISIVLSTCTPYPGHVYQAPVPLADGTQHECDVIRSELARQQRIVALSSVMATPLVEASVRLNVANVISGLETRAAIAGCPV